MPFKFKKHIMQVFHGILLRRHVITSLPSTSDRGVVNCKYKE